MSEMGTLAKSSANEPIFFHYTLGHSMNSTGADIVKFDTPKAISPKRIYDESTWKVTIEEEGLYYFYVHCLPVDMSCAIVRHLKRGQQIYVRKNNKLFGSSYPHTGFLGFKLQ